MAKLRASVRFPRDIALGAALLLTACSSGSGAPAGGGNNNTGGTPPPPPTGFAVFTSSRTIANVYEPWIASYDGAGNLGFADSIWLDFGKLPPGLTVDANGNLSGTPTTTGTFMPLLRIEDASMRSDEQVIPMTILSALFGDSDNDGDVDYFDLQQYIVCAEDETPSGACLISFDDDGNDRVDLYDFARFQQVFTGPL